MRRKPITCLCCFVPAPSSGKRRVGARDMPLHSSWWTDPSPESDRDASDRPTGQSPRSLPSPPLPGASGSCSETKRCSPGGTRCWPHHGAGDHAEGVAWASTHVWKLWRMQTCAFAFTARASRPSLEDVGASSNWDRAYQGQPRRPADALRPLGRYGQPAFTSSLALLGPWGELAGVRREACDASPRLFTVMERDRREA